MAGPHPNAPWSRQAIDTAQQFIDQGRNAQLSTGPDETAMLVQQILEGGRPVDVYDAQGRLMARHAVEQQGVPMTQQNMQRALAGVTAPNSTSRAASGAGGASEGGTPAPVVPDDVLLGEAPGMTPVPDDGGLTAGEAAALGIAGGAVAGTAAGAVGLRMLGDAPLTPNANGMVVIPEDRPTQPGRVRGMRTITAQQAADEGWAVVGLNYDEGRNLLPPPSSTPERANGTGRPRDAGTGAARGSTGAAGTDAPPPAPRTGNVAGPNAEGPARSSAPDPADAPISTEEVMGSAAGERYVTPLPEGVREVDSAVTNPGTDSRLTDTGQRGPNNELIFRDMTNGGFTARARDGRGINAPTFEALRSALRGL